VIRPLRESNKKPVLTVHLTRGTDNAVSMEPQPMKTSL
jgi:hypothetical protein